MDRIEILNNIKKSSKYKSISDDLILRLIDQYKLNNIKDKTIIKNIKETLHCTHELFLPVSSNISNYIKELKEDIDINKFLSSFTSIHLSTKERSSFVKQFYYDIFNYINISNSIILDIGCGLNAIDLYFNGILNDNKYIGIEINDDNVIILNIIFDKLNIDATFLLQDALTLDFNKKYDVVLLLKLLPILEQQKKGSSKSLLDKLNTNYLVISFPLKTVSGKEVGMLDYYDKFINEILNDNYKIERKLQYCNEIVYIVSKKGKYDKEN